MLDTGYIFFFECHFNQFSGVCFSKKSLIFFYFPPLSNQILVCVLDQCILLILAQPVLRSTSVYVNKVSALLEQRSLHSDSNCGQLTTPYLFAAFPLGRGGRSRVGAHLREFLLPPRDAHPPLQPQVSGEPVTQSPHWSTRWPIISR